MRNFSVRSICTTRPSCTTIWITPNRSEDTCWRKASSQSVAQGTGFSTFTDVEFDDGALISGPN